MQRPGHCAGVVLLNRLANICGFDLQEAIIRSSASINVLVSALKAPLQLVVGASAEAIASLLAHVSEQCDEARKQVTYEEFIRMYKHCQRIAMSGAVTVLVGLVERSPCAPAVCYGAGNALAGFIWLEGGAQQLVLMGVLPMLVHILLQRSTAERQKISAYRQFPKCCDTFAALSKPSRRRTCLGAQRRHRQLCRKHARLCRREGCIRGGYSLKAATRTLSECGCVCAASGSDQMI